MMMMKAREEEERRENSKKTLHILCMMREKERKTAKVPFLLCLPSLYLYLPES